MTAPIGSGAIADGLTVVFAAEPDGWRFQAWHLTSWPDGAPRPPAPSPGHRAMRLVTFDDALEFFRREYGPAVERVLQAPASVPR